MILLDFETTGLLKHTDLPPEKQPSMIEASFMKVDDRSLKLQSRSHFLIKPSNGQRISAEVTKITGLKDVDLKKAKAFGEHYAFIGRLFRGEQYMVAHNCAFESMVLFWELKRIGMHLHFPWPMIWLCTVEASYHIEGYRLSLEALYQLVTGKELKGAHRTDTDVDALFVCLKWLIKKKHIQLCR